MGSKDKLFNLKLIFLNTTQYVIYVLYSLLAIPLATIYVMLKALFSARRSTHRRVRKLIGFWAMGISFITLPFVKVRYKSNEANSEIGACIYICNHRSFLDGFLVAHPCRRREVVQVVNVWPFKIPVIGVIAKVAGYLNVKAMPFNEFSSIAKSLIGNGVSIVSFPEGTRSKGKAMGSFHGSMFRIALEVGCPIVPICISGNEKVLLRGNVMMRPGEIKIHELPALEWNEYKDIAPFQLKIKVRNMIIRELTVMDGGV